MKTEMKASNECLYPTDVFLISCGMGCKRITVSDIAYIEAMKDNCIIHMVDGKRYTQSCPMGDIEPELNPNIFKRIHRSFIVNIRYIDMYYYGHVVLENGMEVHIGVVDADSGNIQKFTSANRWADKATETWFINGVFIYGCFNFVCKTQNIIKTYFPQMYKLTFPISMPHTLLRLRGVW